MTVITVIVSVLLYFGMAGINTALRERFLTWGKYDDGDRVTVHVLSGIIWPIYMPALLFYVLFKHGPPKIPKRFKKDTEVIKGVPKPTNILAGMVAAKIIRNFDKVTRKPESFRDHELCYTQEGIDVSIRWADSWQRYTCLAFKVGDKLFEDSESQVLEAMKKAWELKQEKERAEREYRQEEHALTAIATL